MPENALIHEASPYLRQHAHNPVCWLPWGASAFAAAQRENKPVFLSIGYAACHWCHVMAHESFEDAEIAAFLNEHFVPVKVDREERPDVDHHYMQAVQSLSGHGGWPLSVFLTPDLKPFYGGTYWPPAAKWGRPGFRDVLRSVAEAWEKQQSEVASSADEIHKALAQITAIRGTDGEIKRSFIAGALLAAEQQFDRVYGGFGPAPKFPHAMDLALLLRQAVRPDATMARTMVVFTLERMARGGIYDQLGGGFHRYSTDARWLIPHFEKMLYDNALLAPVYLDAGRLTENRDFLQVGTEILEWALRELRAGDGGFVSSLDADSEGEEGKFYLWTPDEIAAVLGDERASRFCRIFDITATGNVADGRSVPNQPQAPATWAELLDVSADALAQEIAEDRAKLLATREQRPRPARDDKVLADWNGLMLTALVRGFAVTGEERYLEAAQQTAARLLEPFETRGRLVHSALGDKTQETPLLLDYAALGCGLLDLFMADGDARWFRGATALARAMEKHFANPGGPYFMSADDVAGTRAVDPYDSALPAGTSLAGILMARLHHLTGDPWYLERAQAQVRPIASLLERMPLAFSQALLTVELLLHPPAQLVLAGDRDRELWHVAQQVYVPNLLVLWQPDGSQALPDELSVLTRGMQPLDGKPTAYLCRNFVCEMPVTSAPELLESLLKAAAEATL